MTRLIIRPDGTDGLLDVSLQQAEAAGRNSVDVLNDRPDAVDDGTYQNHGD
jgi:hypothetical protein